MASGIKESLPCLSFQNVQETGEALKAAAFDLDLEQAQALITHLGCLVSAEKKWSDAIEQIRLVRLAMEKVLPDKAMQCSALDLDQSSKQLLKSQLDTARKITEILCQKDSVYQIRELNYGVLREVKQSIIKYQEKVYLLKLAALSLDCKQVERQSEQLYDLYINDRERIQVLEEIIQQVKSVFPLSNDKANAILRILSEEKKFSENCERKEKYRAIRESNVRNYDEKSKT